MCVQGVFHDVTEDECIQVVHQTLKAGRDLLACALRVRARVCGVGTRARTRTRRAGRRVRRVPCQRGRAPCRSRARSNQPDAARDPGVNVIDSAPWYGQGKSETMLGLALKGHQTSTQPENPNPNSSPLNPKL